MTETPRAADDGAVATAPAGAPDDAEAATPTAATESLVEDELLVEEISIDGMCGVY